MDLKTLQDYAKRSDDHAGSVSLSCFDINGGRANIWLSSSMCDAAKQAGIKIISKDQLISKLSSPHVLYYGPFFEKHGKRFCASGFVTYEQDCFAVRLSEEDLLKVASLQDSIKTMLVLGGHMVVEHKHKRPRELWNKVTGREKYELPDP